MRRELAQRNRLGSAAAHLFHVAGEEALYHQVADVQCDLQRGIARDALEGTDDFFHDFVGVRRVAWSKGLRGRSRHGRFGFGGVRHVHQALGFADRDAVVLLCAPGLRRVRMACGRAAVNVDQVTLAGVTSVFLRGNTATCSNMGFGVEYPPSRASS